jgi:hypothetical protein
MDWSLLRNVYAAVIYSFEENLKEEIDKEKVVELLYSGGNPTILVTKHICRTNISYR